MTYPRHATVDTRFPPAEDTVAGSLMLALATGQARDDLEQLIEDVTVVDDVEEYYPDEPTRRERARADRRAGRCARPRRRPGGRGARR